MVTEEVPYSSNKAAARKNAAEEVLVKQIPVDDETHRLLSEIDEFGETYRDIVAHITKHYASCSEVGKDRKRND
jgi:hypothetical protein